MRSTSLIKLGIYAAAGYGTYEILRRYGLLDKAGQWLQDNVPEDVQTKIREHIDQAKGQIQQARTQVGEQYANYRDQAQEQFQNLKTKAADELHHAREKFDHAKEVATNKWNGYTASNEPNAPVAEEADSTGTEPQAGGQTITGPGRGSDDVTQDANGSTVHHRVGRGVVNG